MVKPFKIARSGPRALSQVTAAINHPNVTSKYIKFPLTQRHREDIKRDFSTKFGIPDVIGCIDGTHVSIVRPEEHEERYFNRKGHHSLNVQIICDADLKILSVDPSNPGSTHDSTVWSNHPLKPYLDQVATSSGEDIFLLGDSGYPLRRTLMTPILNAAYGSPEAHYYELHVTARNTVERCIGLLKSRFRCLLRARTLHYDPKTAARIINACCVLHNIALEESVEVPALSPEEQHQLDEELRQSATDSSVRASEEPNTRARRAAGELERGRAYQQQLVQRLWRMRRT